METMLLEALGSMNEIFEFDRLLLKGQLLTANKGNHFLFAKHI